MIHVAASLDEAKAAADRAFTALGHHSVAATQ
jgi:hypothetical protein